MGFPHYLGDGGIISYIDNKRDKPISSFSSKPVPEGWDKESDETMKRIGIPLWVGALVFGAFFAVLITIILLVKVAGVQNVYLDMFSIMFRIGSIIFGGGQVVLPMLQDEVVPSWMSTDQFLQGLALAQSMPGPLFNFSAYLGAVYKGVGGALVAWTGLFAPGVVLIFAMVPFWARLRHNQTFKVILNGISATAIGLVGAACVILWESAIKTSADAVVFCISLAFAVVVELAAPLCILIGGVVGAILHPDALNYGQQPYCIYQGFLPPA
jgi:chromate transporter